MKLVHLVFVCVVVVVGLTGCASRCSCTDVIEAEGLIAPGATLQEVSTDFKFTEGPATDVQGNVYFTDQPNDRIMIYTTEGKLETFMQPAGRANGMYFDQDGYLLACADDNSELWKIDVATKEHEVLARDYQGVRLNSTNDLWVRPDGNIYITDPFYKRPWWTHDKPTQDGQHVYFLKPDTGELTRVLDDLVQPNGLIGTPDGKTLYLSDIKGGRIYQYDVQKDGALTNRKLFCEMGSDGMTLDCCGNVYLANRKGVVVFDKAGQQIENIKIPQGWTANVTFGGKDRKLLFVTAKTGVYTLQMNVCGAK
ncbi:SMP-30/gluconolactonase/LRE family protein [Planctomycetota bacterium]